MLTINGVDQSDLLKEVGALVLYAKADGSIDVGPAYPRESICPGCGRPIEPIAAVRTYHAGCDPYWRIGKLETELAAANALIHAMTPPLTEADIAAATAEAIAIRPLIEAEEARNARIERLEKALSRCNEAATEAGNDERHTPGERTVARGIGAIIRNEIAALAKPEKGRE